MKIGVECKSPLLQKSVELFLESKLSSLKQCDIVVRDFKKQSDERSFYISKDSDADLVKPFSKSSLILALEVKYKTLALDDLDDLDDEIPNNNLLDDSSTNIDKNTNMDFSILEKRINKLTQEYQNNILQTVKAFYSLQPEI